MTVRTYRTRWLELHTQNEEHRRRSVADSTYPFFDVFRGWDQNSMPESQAEDELALAALPILYAAVDNGLACRYLERATAIIERVEREGKLQSGNCVGAWPLNRGTLLRVKSYSSALLGRNWSAEWLQQAASDYVAWALDTPRGAWNGQCQANYLSGVRLLLLIGEFVRARDLLKVKKPLKSHQREADLWKRLVTHELGTVRRDRELLGNLDSYFDLVRDPDFKPDVFMDIELVRLEIGALRDKYFMSSDGTIDWRRVIDAISA